MKAILDYYDYIEKEDRKLFQHAIDSPGFFIGMAIIFAASSGVIVGIPFLSSESIAC